MFTTTNSPGSLQREHTPVRELNVITLQALLRQTQSRRGIGLEQQ
jgi:hypothetical protein